MSNFFAGFTDELTKTAGHPLFRQISRSGTLLGQRVQAIIHKIKRGEGVVDNGNKKTAGLRSAMKRILGGGVAPKASGVREISKAELLRDIAAMGPRGAEPMKMPLSRKVPLLR